MTMELEYTQHNVFVVLGDEYPSIKINPSELALIGQVGLKLGDGYYVEDSSDKNLYRTLRNMMKKDLIYKSSYNLLYSKTIYRLTPLGGFVYEKHFLVMDK